MAVEILNETDDDVDVESLQRLCAFLYESLHLHPEAELSLICVDDAAMEQLHLEWMDLPDATDVMSFPMDELRPGTVAQPTQGLLGDIVICPSVAAQQAKRMGHSTDDEILLLATHGMLHLLGFDHDEPDDKEQMFALQNELLTAFLGRPAPSPTET
ncbi:rRNA maturation RNase YbeY [Citricoccus muralis]|uniref:Endoribonuclease YbeY n=1 Tax=Citricoccus muralis TaxID=169134 RepID=A0ABY8H300_9MICC|nr:rRNA maturation RNase YbeY [Citricoccus muralis]WFP15391.1 rRNA maturation RNase YbeY [Citricoccus muralis]